MIAQGKTGVKRGFRIRLYKSTALLYEVVVPCDMLPGRRLGELMKVLVAKHGLSDDEIVNCFVTRNSKRHMEHLELTKENNKNRRETFYYCYCGSNPHAVAMPVNL